MNRAFCCHCGHIEYYYSIRPARCALCMEAIEVKIIMIDPGHGGDDNGAVWGYAEEDDINLIVSFLLRCELEKRGLEVYLTRESDYAVSLHKRTDHANSLQLDLFVSIHCDAFHKTSASGMSVHIYPGHSNETLSLAQKVSSMLAMDFKSRLNRGVKKSNFYVLRETTMPAVLIECEFLSNPKARKFLREPENQLAMARAIAKGIV